MPAWIGCSAATKKGAIVALRTGLYEFEADTGELRFLASAPYDPRRFLFNDGRCDRRGRFFAGPMYLPLSPAISAAPKRLRRCGATTAPTEGRVGRRDPGRGFQRSRLEPRRRTMYHADTQPEDDLGLRL